ncbi:hypothetical protein F444_21633 [Phytophthora nicotianae P1976]|uniref:Uncharacterized protein n=1 Tax=Phytophthora nicotianae P1976 TaxID=1317066 RepID=A0A080Z0G9_PHYNI|nr:hypothetical protein F444_21633 [Phytophthora nicotianae P1976]
MFCQLVRSSANGDKWGTMSESEPEVHVPSTGMWESSPIAKEWHESWEAFKEIQHKP